MNMTRAARPLCIAAIASFLALLPMGCVEIDGGAVEVSWAIFAPDGRAITDCGCANPSIAFVRLQLVSQLDGAEPCAGNDACRFACGPKTGATPFTVPPGHYLMSVVAVGSAGADLPTVAVPGDPTLAVSTPAPLSATVVRGQPTELEAFTLHAACASQCDGGGIFNPCTDD